MSFFLFLLSSLASKLEALLARPLLQGNRSTFSLFYFSCSAGREDCPLSVLRRMSRKPREASRSKPLVCTSLAHLRRLASVRWAGSTGLAVPCFQQGCFFSTPHSLQVTLKTRRMSRQDSRTQTVTTNPTLNDP